MKILFSNSQCHIVQLHLPAHIATSGKQSLQDMQALHVTINRGPRISFATGRRHTDRPNAIIGELCKIASLLRLPGMAADRGLPATRLPMSGLAPSLTAAGPGRSTVSAQHHAAAARRLTGPSLCPCDEPSTQGYDSLAVPTPKCRHTPADADRGAGHHIPA